MARLVYRAVGAAGAYPEWLRELDGKSGAYVIKQGRDVVYVGESHKGRLRSTMRNFQGWARRKDWWRF